jgi:Bacterial low temperature requirement A protein (LtrA)
MAATAVEQEHRVTPRELFFDLVFVFAFTQVTTLLAHEPTFAGIGRGVLVLAALWWPWTAYAWLTNTVDPEEGLVGASSSITEPGRPWVMISGNASSCSDRTWIKWISTPSISVVNCGSALSMASALRQSYSVAQ